MTDQAAGIGHNLPDEIRGPNFAELSDRCGDLTTNADAWIEEVEEIADEDQARKANDFLAQARAAKKAVDAERKARKEPFREKGAAVDDAFNPLKDVCDLIVESIRAKLTPWLDAKQKKLDEEKAEKERIAKEAAEKAEEARKAAEAPKASIETQQAAQTAETEAKDAGKAATRAPEVARAGSQYGGRAASLRAYEEIVITDRTAITAKQCKGIIALMQTAEIETYLRRDFEFARTCDGVSITVKSKAV